MSNDDDMVSNPTDNETFEDVIDVRLSRRGVLGGGLAVAAASALGGIESIVQAVPAAADDEDHDDDRHRPRPLLGFGGIPVSTLDEVVVPEGYTARPLIRWGDPVSHGPVFRPDASNSAAEQAKQWGMHNDGVVYFPMDGSRRGLLVQNNEYTDEGLLFTGGVAGWTAEKTAKSQNAHGVSIIEIRRHRHDGWRVVRPSKYARRITGSSPIRIGGPAAGDGLLCTSADPTGKRVLGTFNNCAMGYTPWGTYLACEENFNGYFRKTAAPTPAEARYGINAVS